MALPLIGYVHFGQVHFPLWVTISPFIMVSSHNVGAGPPLRALIMIKLGNEREGI